MSARELHETTAAMRAYIARKVAAGFNSSSDIIRDAVEVHAEEAEPSVLQPLAARMAQEEVEAHLRAQATWPDVTDCERLDDAFAELNDRGIVCRQDFSCCGNCGVYEIGGEMHAQRVAGRTVRGYAFYHMQDTGGAVERGGLYLNYGSAEQGEDAAVKVGREIVAALERHGLKTTWNGRWDTRIGVELDWKRRRPREVLA
jgi:hypothetical protein